MLPIEYEPEDSTKIIVGTDEVGRGSLIGPVTAAAVIWDVDFVPKTKDEEKLLELVKDSKKLSEKNRMRVSEFIKQNAKAYSIADVDNTVIDEINILKATYLAMHRALKSLGIEFDKIYVDGNSFKPFIGKDCMFVPHTCLVNGDNHLFQIAAASILAKTHRDSLIKNIHEQNEAYHVYSWDKNKGYGTKVHMDAIRQHGITPLHRRTFLKKLT
jgi:ribonuclease HII